MDMRLFLSTFLLIFLAELGDKTQLTAMARAAGSDGGKWTVFLAAGSALLLSSLLAVTVGRVIARVVPDHVIRLLAAAIFIAFGILLLIGALRSESDAEPAEELSSSKRGMMMRAILHIAAEFEEASVADYHALAERTDNPAVKLLFQELAADEKAHLLMMRNAGADHAQAEFAELQRADLPSSPELEHDVAISNRPDLQHALEHEKATMAFYHELAGRTAIPALRRTFTYLANAEQDHIQRIEKLMGESVQHGA